MADKAETMHNSDKMNHEGKDPKHSASCQGGKCGC